MKIRLRKRAGWAAMGAAAALALTACGGGGNGGASGEEGQVSGPVVIDGSSTVEPLSSAAAELFMEQHPDVNVTVGTSGTGGGFEKFCAGQTDISDASRPIKDEEKAACEAAGVECTELLVATDALTVVVNPDLDVDCLTVDQVRDLYRAGSPLTNWSQEPLGFDDVPLKVGGPNPDNNGFGFFGRYVLGAPEPSQVDLRSDYFLAENDEEARQFVVGKRTLELRASRFDDISRRRAQANQALQDARTEMAAARAELEIALAERAKGIRDERPPADKAKDQRRVDKAFERRSAARVRLNAVELRYEQVDEVYRNTGEARRLYEAYRGHVAYFRFSYYELFEDQLRPFEITRPDGQTNCIFPSQRTITSGEYPLSRQLLITTTTRSLALTAADPPGAVRPAYPDRRRVAGSAGWRGCRPTSWMRWCLPDKGRHASSRRPPRRRSESRWQGYVQPCAPEPARAAGRVPCRQHRVAASRSAARAGLPQWPPSAPAHRRGP